MCMVADILFATSAYLMVWAIYMFYLAGRAIDNPSLGNSMFTKPPLWPLYLSLTLLCTCIRILGGLLTYIKPSRLGERR